ncbi:hypothetical protein J4477_00985 [Candidatus Pacearchaeota archaeon]|nr:hypothetical protein [Candidatus Pacearchaeota archaeon]
MDKSRTITGIIIIIIGITLLVVSLFLWPIAIYGIVLLIIGFLILIDFGRENYVEQIKTRGKYKKSR